MSGEQFGLAFIEGLIARCLDGAAFEEIPGESGGPRLALKQAADPAVPAGHVRLWAARGDGLLDRMIHFRLLSAPVDTQLLFVFGRSDTAMPHFHAQVVQFSADGCVYNADLLPRLDAVDHPEYFRSVFGPLSKAYWRATKNIDNVCARAPANPALVPYLSPWGIATGSPTDRAELERVAPQLEAYAEHFLSLVNGFDVPDLDPGALRDRDRRHLDCFFDERLDPRAWKGVYRVIGERAGQHVRHLLKKQLRDIS